MNVFSYKSGFIAAITINPNVNLRSLTLHLKSTSFLMHRDTFHIKNTCPSIRHVEKYFTLRLIRQIYLILKLTFFVLLLSIIIYLFFYL